VINPGNVGTPEVLSDLAEIGAPATDAIPLEDLLMIIDSLNIIMHLPPPSVTVFCIEVFGQVITDVGQTCNS